MISDGQQDREPEISSLHFDVQIALVMVETSQLSVKVFDQLVDTM